MSLATDLRQFLLDDVDVTLTQVCQGFVPELAQRPDGFIWYKRRGTEHARTFEQARTVPESQYFDVEIYHTDIDVVEANADAIQLLDMFNGDFGVGQVGAVFVNDQGDDYVPKVPFSDDEHLESSFLSLEIRGYTAP
jgi:hypothetical protein